MKQARVLVVLAAVFILLCAVFLGLYITRDKTAPVITFSDEAITYTEGTDKKSLLAGVTATDNRDGDISNRLIVDKVTPKSDGSAAVVRYIVQDSVGNVASATREVAYTGATGKPASGSIKAAATPTPAPQATASPSPSPAPSADPALPVITLSAPEVSTPVGQEVYLLGFVESVSDDADDQDYLFTHISILGDEVDFYTKGTYQISFVVIDSAGNSSLPANFTVKVE